MSYPRGIVHQITSGVAGWLTYEQMRDGVDNLSEHSLYAPIEAIPKGRGFEVKGQFPLLREKGRLGAPKTIDFLVVDRADRLVLALEIKFKQAGKKLAGSLTQDAEKLLSLKIPAIDKQIAADSAGPIRDSVDGFNLIRAVMFVWRGHSIQAVFKAENIVLQRQFASLVQESSAGDSRPPMNGLDRFFKKQATTRPVGLPSGSIRSGSTITGNRFWVASLIETPEWKTISA